MSDYIVTHGIRIAKDFVPETFGRLTTIGPRFLLGGRERVAFVVCLCTCGNHVVVARRNARNGRTQSCGCLQKERVRASGTKHGKHRSSEYNSWQSMKARCCNPNTIGYANYGGRGVSVYQDWKDPETGFANFIAYMGAKPTPTHTIDRYPDKDGNYEPGNVRWATPTEQSRNIRTNVNITYNGKTQCIAAWAGEVGLTPNALYYRLSSGWPLEKALCTPGITRKNSSG